MAASQQHASVALGQAKIVMLDTFKNIILEVHPSKDAIQSHTELTTDDNSLHSFVSIFFLKAVPSRYEDNTISSSLHSLLQVLSRVESKQFTRHSVFSSESNCYRSVPQP